MIPKIEKLVVKMSFPDVSEEEFRMIFNGIYKEFISGEYDIPKKDFESWADFLLLVHKNNLIFPSWDEKLLALFAGRIMEAME